MSFPFLIYITLCGWATSHYAEKRGRNELFWFMIGVFTGVFGLIILYLLPPLKMSESARPMQFQNSHEEDKSIDITPLPAATFKNLPETGWFYLDEKYYQQGPVSFDYLKGLWDSKVISQTHFIWNSMMDEWHKIEDCADVLSALKSPSKSL